jgi:hypothetical protein
MSSGIFNLRDSGSFFTQRSIKNNLDSTLLISSIARLNTKNYLREYLKIVSEIHDDIKIDVNWNTLPSDLEIIKKLWVYREIENVLK